MDGPVPWSLAVSCVIKVLQQRSPWLRGRSPDHASDENVYDKLWGTFTNITHQRHTDQTCYPNHDMLAAWLWAKDINLVDNHWSHFACNGLKPTCIPSFTEELGWIEFFLATKLFILRFNSIHIEGWHRILQKLTWPFQSPPCCLLTLSRVLVIGGPIVPGLTSKNDPGPG